MLKISVAEVVSLGQLQGKSGQGGNAKEAGEIGGGDLSNEASAFYKQ